MLHSLASLLILQERFLQSPAITDTGLLQGCPVFATDGGYAEIAGANFCKTNILRDLCALYEISGLISKQYRG